MPNISQLKAQERGPIGRIDRIEGTGDVNVSIRRADVTHKYKIAFDKLEALLLAYSEHKNISLSATPARMGVSSG